jgi:antitoxin component YwqK of YwqJK toxin-antitoxin module
MKKNFLTALLLQITYLVNAQGYKLFIDDNGKPTDAFKATSYIIVKQVADTALFMQQYDMENAILQSGAFKDKNLKIPDGKFVYYRKLNFYNNQTMKDILKSDTANYIMTEGEFKNGKRDGKWIDYFIGGKKREEVYYKDGVLNGPYNSYNDDRSTIGLSGNYVGGKREGEWNMFGLDGRVMETDKYRNGKVYSRKMMLGTYNSPKPPHGFETYFTRAFRKAITAQNIENVTIDYSIVFTVTVDGKVVKPALSAPGQDKDPLAKTLLAVMESSPQWKPANTGDKNKPHEDFAIISVEINKGSITTKVLDYAKYKAAYHYLNH